MGKLMPLTSKNYRLVMTEYPPDFPPYPPFEMKPHPLEKELRNLQLPVDPYSKKAFLNKEMWKDFSPYSKNLLVLKFEKRSQKSNIKMSVFLGDPEDKKNEWLWIEISEDSRFKVMELPTKRFLEGRPFYQDRKYDSNSFTRELCIYSDTFKDRKGGFLIFLDDCKTIKGPFSWEKFDKRVLGFFELRNRWVKKGKILPWKISYNRNDTYNVGIEEFDTYRHKSDLLGAYATVKSKISNCGKSQYEFTLTTELSCKNSQFHNYKTTMSYKCSRHSPTKVNLKVIFKNLTSV